MRRTRMQQDKEVEIYSNSETKGLNELKINEGIDLYIEEKIPNAVFDATSGQSFDN